MNMTESELRNMLDRYVQGKATESEVKLLEDFFNSYDPGNAQMLYPDDLKAEILSNIRDRTGADEQRFQWRTVAKIAASVAVIAAIAFAGIRYVTNTSVTETPVITAVEETKRGEKSEFTLPDGTVVHLNGGSSLTYASTFSENRNVILTGEGYFDVTHDPSRPFTVSAGDSRVTVLGTSFNVKANPSKNLEITLVSGKVKVASSGETLDLEPGLQAVVDINTNQIASSKVDVRKFISWKDNILFFDRTSMADVVETLETWYDTDITVNSTLKNCTITGQYKEESLENVLKSLEFLLNAKVDFQNPKAITIKGDGCKK